VVKTKKGEYRDAGSNDRIIVFAKQPNAGKVKTRLIPAIGAQSAAQLHALMTRQIVAVACASNTCPVELWCSPTPDHALFAQLAQAFPVSLRTQMGGDLGERMYNAFRNVAVGYDCGVDMDVDDTKSVVIVGSDCPTLTPSHFHQAFAALKAGNSATLVPAPDGGYVLLGLRRLRRQLFDEIQWGTEAVLPTTRTRLQSLQWTWQESSAVSDIDTQQDLEMLASCYKQHKLNEELVTFLRRLPELLSAR